MTLYSLLYSNETDKAPFLAIRRLKQSYTNSNSPPSSLPLLFLFRLHFRLQFRLQFRFRFRFRFRFQIQAKVRIQGYV